ncbi:TPA: hypothetical protein QDB40_004860 [Burkholderia vietnamiensis]|uniref:hypothetical protein n=1 Tax=Burkholderia cepacia complex TaxID=87882 RepID=UPI0015937A0B|nr:hypothetical protein [Burkholderia vietnamiensis]HDR9100011.1 hypothetical protein [Burkholderia vietnamiensis]HDR9170827.1 hypothetical protein [Burkholderia vietnamiensis]
MSKIDAQTLELLDQVKSGKADFSEFLKLADILKEKGIQESKSKLQERLQKVKDLIDELKLNHEDVIEFLEGPKEELIKWTDENGVEWIRKDGDLATQKWLKELSKKISQAELEKHIVATSDQGKTKAKKTIAGLYVAKTETK